MPCASSFDEILRQQRISSTDQKEGEEGGDEDFGDEDDDWSIRASMGLDRTLDDERQWLQDDMLLYRGFVKVKERGCAVKEGAYDDEEVTARAYDLAETWNTYQYSGEKKISGGVKNNGGQGDVVVVGFTSHRLRLEEIGFYFNMRYFEDTDEEDEYDKVALGKDDGGKGVSMEVAISRPCGVRIRDPRANHAAAKMRLNEDELVANK
ncbi:hypothetical protein F2Q69_00043817 [Brassica cretica]|uniref:Uncharacterized protein n=1 Tax=Brassica cretica TaxID=69181 RepID=A0A8S9NBE9_BRACR|nr:hypothetical protein F2Q69_00043817 [Brassica cretica]